MLNSKTAFHVIFYIPLDSDYVTKIQLIGINTLNVH